MKINGVEFELDTMDLEVSEKIDKELEKAKDIFNNIEKLVTSRSGAIKLVVDTTFNFFDNIFGKDASEKIFKGKKNFNLCFNVFDNFVTELNQNDKNSLSNFEENYKKYSPDRAARRNNKYKKKSKR